MSTLVAAPDRSLQQRMDALQKANDIRSKRASLKRDIKAGRASVIGLLEKPPEWLETMKVVDLLLAMPKAGRVKANKMLNTTRMSHSKTVSGMSERQRGELVTLLK